MFSKWKRHIFEWISFQSHFLEFLNTNISISHNEPCNKNVESNSHWTNVKKEMKCLFYFLRDMLYPHISSTCVTERPFQLYYQIINSYLLVSVQHYLFTLTFPLAKMSRQQNRSDPLCNKTATTFSQGCHTSKLALDAAKTGYFVWTGNIVRTWNEKKLVRIICCCK